MSAASTCFEDVERLSALRQYFRGNVGLGNVDGEPSASMSKRQLARQQQQELRMAEERGKRLARRIAKRRAHKASQQEGDANNLNDKPVGPNMERRASTSTVQGLVKAAVARRDSEAQAESKHGAENSTRRRMGRRTSLGTRLRRHAENGVDASGDEAETAFSSSSEDAKQRQPQLRAAPQPQYYRDPMLTQQEKASKDLEKDRVASMSRAGQPASLKTSPYAPNRRNLQKEQGSEKKQMLQHMEPEAVWMGVFNKMKDDGQIHHDDLLRALGLAGFQCPDQQWVDEVYNQLTKYSSISQDEFVRFVRGYSQRQRQAYAEAFSRWDEDGSGMVESAELVKLLRSFGIEPMNHVLNEIVGEVDEDNCHALNLAEFERVMDIIRAREGFSKKEYNEFMMVYMKFDRDGSGEIDSTELMNALAWLGYAVNAVRANEIVAQVDVDGSGCINEREYLMCMRKVREHEISIVAEAMTLGDEDGSGTLAHSEIEGVLKLLGYVPDNDAVSEACFEANITDDTELDLCHFWQLLTVYRGREGFSASEAADIQEAFDLYHRDDSGEITTSEMGRLLRWLGYALQFQVVQQFIAKVDVDASGKLSLPEIRKMIRMLHEKELKQMRWVFGKYDSGGKGAISKMNMQLALKELDLDVGIVSAVAMAEKSDIANDTAIDLKRFAHIVKCFRKMGRQFFRDNCGFSPKELEELKCVFKSYDADGGGEIANRELIQLVEDVFPDMAHDKAMRPKLLQIMETVDSDHSGSLDFRDFLCLMQLLREAQDDEKVIKEQIAVKTTMFTPQEVEGFRELFIDAANDSSSLSLSAVRKMISLITPLGDQRTEELYRHVRDVVSAKLQKLGNESIQLDFPEFLRLMRKLLDLNFARIKDTTTEY
jgi:Ca2+-binding EF-hand superfamily protein